MGDEEGEDGAGGMGRLVMVKALCATMAAVAGGICGPGGGPFLLLLLLAVGLGSDFLRNRWRAVGKRLDAV